MNTEDIYKMDIVFEKDNTKGYITYVCDKKVEMEINGFSFEIEDDINTFLKNNKIDINNIKENDIINVNNVEIKIISIDIESIDDFNMSCEMIEMQNWIDFE